MLFLQLWPNLWRPNPRVRVHDLHHKDAEKSNDPHQMNLENLTGRTRHLHPEKFITRRTELLQKKPLKQLSLYNDSLTVKEKPSDHVCSTRTELELVQALRRRALAFDLIGLISYETMNNYHADLPSHLQEDAPPGYCNTTTNSLGTLGPRPLRLLFPFALLLSFLEGRSGLAGAGGVSSCLRLLALLAGAPGLAGAPCFGGLLAKGSRWKLTLGLVKTFGSSISRGNSPDVFLFM